MVAYVPGTEETDLKKLIMSLQQLAAGRSNAYGTFTCTPNQATTVVTDANVSAESRILPMATTANAAAEMGAGTLYIGTVANGTFTVTHANSATTGRIFKYAVHG